MVDEWLLCRLLLEWKFIDGKMRLIGLDFGLELVGGNLSDSDRILGWCYGLWTHFPRT